MNATARIPKAWLGAALCLLLAAGLPAWGQTNSVGTGDDLRIQGDDPTVSSLELDSSGDDSGNFDLNTGLSINRPLRISGRAADTALDNTITASNATDDATIVVERNGRLHLQNLTITSTGGRAAIRVLPGGTLILERVLVEGSAAEGVITVDETGITDPAIITVTSSVFNNNADEAILSEARNAQINVLQSTFLGNGGGVRHNQTSDPEQGTSHINVAASIFEGSGTPLRSNNPALQIRSDFNYVDVSTGTNVDPFNVVTDPPQFVATSPEFPGQMESALLSEQSFGLLRGEMQAAVGAYWFRDFEGEPRNPVNLELGADEILGFTTPIWLNVFVTVGNVEDRILGPNKSATIRISVANIDMDGGAILIRPELGTLADADTLIRLNNLQTVSDGFLYEASFTPTDTFPFPDPTIPVDGRATIYLVDTNGDVYGDDPADPLGPAIQNDGQGDINERREFIIDTIAPALFQSSNRENELVVASTEDTTVAPLPAGAFNFPIPWEPGFEQIPRSAVLWATGNPRAFTNATSPMALTMGVRFVEVFPELPDGTVVGVESSGFESLSLTLADMSLGEQQDIVYPPTLTQDYHGIAYLQETGADINSGSANIAHLANVETGDDGLARPVLVARWTFGGQVHTPDWRRDFQFAAIDRAGNIANASNEAEVYWLRDPLAQLTGPGDVETSNPEFNWTVAHAGAGVVAPTNVTPSQPIARFSLWRAVDVTQQQWVNIMPWSLWLEDAVINRNSILFPNFGRLGAFLDLPEAQGQVMELVVQVADQAGNLSPLPASLLNLDPTPDILMPGGGGRWGTPGFAATVDTNLQAFFWHNRVDIGDFRAREPGEPFFGAATRIPLPAIDECFYRVEAAFTIGYELSDRQPPAGSRPFSNFQLFEDGRLVASGTIEVPTATLSTSLVIPQDLFFPPSGMVFNQSPQDRTLFLNNPSGDCFDPNLRDRLGDEGEINEDRPEFGNRYRDVSYTLEVQNGYEFLAPGASETVLRFDATPASYTWVVSVDTTLGDEQPIKSFGRD